jgi:hypothetical protein
MTSQKPRAPFPRKGAVIELDQEDLRSEVIIHKNLTQDVLLTTEDQMKLALIEYRDVLAARSEWLSSAVLVLSFLSSLLLSDFKDVGPITAATWQAVYFIFLILAVFRFGNVVIKMYQNRKRARIDFVISKIKADGLEPEVKEGQANGS